MNGYVSKVTGGGSSSGSGGGGAISQVGGALGGGLSEGWKQIGGGFADANPVPHNNYHADTPTLNTIDFAAAIKQMMGQGGPNMAASDTAGAQQGALGQVLAGQGSAALGQQGSFADALQGRAAGTYGQQQQLIGQLQQDAAGNGPGAQLAQNMLHQATDQNIAQNTGMIASQKGINPALAARLASQNAAQMSQQAAGQGTNLALQNTLAARGQLGSVLGNAYSQDVGGATSNLNNVTGVGVGTGANLVNTGRGQDIQQSLGTGQLQNQQLGDLISGNSSQNSTISGNALGTQQINSGVAAGNTKAASDVEGGILNGIGAVAASAAGKGKAHGGEIEGEANVAGDSPANDTVPIMASPGEVVLPRTVAHDPDKAKRFVEALQSKKGKEEPTTAGHFKTLRSIREQLAELETQLGRASK